MAKVDLLLVPTALHLRFEGRLRHAKAGLSGDASAVRKNYSGQSFVSFHCVVSSELVIETLVNAGRHVKITSTKKFHYFHLCPLPHTWLPDLVQEF